jgi:outer membrane cobalamin receptor
MQNGVAMSRGFHSFRERRDFLLYIVLAAAGFFIRQIDNSPIPGAWIGFENCWFGFADSNGFYSFSGEESDSLVVHATGYADWAGIKPENNETITLLETVINTGEQITVIASRGSLAGQVPSTVSLGEKDISDLSRTGLNSLNGRVPGVSVREYGGSIPVTSVSLRGGDPSQADQMIDGLSIVSSRDGMPTGIFDPAVFSSVEIARGGAVPGGSGTGSAGAINYLPPLYSQPLSFSITGVSQGGAYFSGKYRGTGVSLRRNVSSSGSIGYSTTLLTTRSYNLWRMGFLGAWAAGEVEGPDWAPESDTFRKQGQAESFATMATDKLEISFSAGAGLMNYHQLEPSFRDDTHKDLTLRTSVQWNGPFTIRGGFNTTWLNSTATDDHDVQFGTVHVTETAGVFTAAAGLRLSPGENLHLSGRASAEHSIFSNRLTLLASVFTDHRVPTINDLYWPGDAFAIGNPALKSERVTGAETAAEWNGNLIRGRICGFMTLSDDLIIWLPDEDGVWTPSNISSSLSRGLELSCGFYPGAGSVSGTFTWNIATDETADTPREGMLLPYRPEYTWGIASDWEVPGDLLLCIHLSGMGKRFTNRTQSEYLGEYWLLDATLGRQIIPHIRLELGAANIFNTDYYETGGYTGRGRTLRITLEYTGE